MATALIVGILVYLIFYDDYYVSVHENRLYILRFFRDHFYIEIPKDALFWRIFRNHFTDGIWAYAVTWAFMALGKKHFISFAACSVACTLAEIVQLFPPLNHHSTFDWMDVLIQLIGIAIAVLIAKFYLHIVKKKQSIS